MISYDTVEANVQRMLRLLPTAVTLDAFEVNLVFSSPVLSALPCNLGPARQMVAQDAGRARAEALRAMLTLLGHHQWLSASRDSAVLLSEAQTRWASAQSVAQQGLAEMRAMAARTDRPWNGRSESAQRTWTVEQRDAQQQLVESTGHLARGCADANTLINTVMMRAAATVMSGLYGALPRVNRAPSAGTGMFALNSRVKALARALESTAAGYGELRGGSDWRGRSWQIADLYDGETNRLARSIARQLAL